MAIGGRQPPRGAVVALSAAVVVLLVTDGVVVGEALRSRRAPSFATGGEFVVTSGGDATGPSTTVTVSSTTSVPVSPQRAVTTTSSTTTIPRTTSTTAVPAEPTPAPPLRPPAAGRYTFSVVGTESASIVGSRTFDPQLTVVVHGAAGLTADQVVLDYTFSSQHEEREIVTYRPDGVSLANEGGSITFGLITEASEVSFDPPMGQVPAPLVTGAARSGTSTARSPGGSIVRVDDWETRVVGRETLVIAGAPVETSVVSFSRRSRPGNEVVTQRTTLWFDPRAGAEREGPGRYPRRPDQRTADPHLRRPVHGHARVVTGLRLPSPPGSGSAVKPAVGPRRPPPAPPRSGRPRAPRSRSRARWSRAAPRRARRPGPAC